MPSQQASQFRHLCACGPQCLLRESLLQKLNHSPERTGHLKPCLLCVPLHPYTPHCRRLAAPLPSRSRQPTAPALYPGHHSAYSLHASTPSPCACQQSRSPAGASTVSGFAATALVLYRPIAAAALLLHGVVRLRWWPGAQEGMTGGPVSFRARAAAVDVAGATPKACHLLCNTAHETWSRSFADCTPLEQSIGPKRPPSCVSDMLDV